MDSKYILETEHISKSFGSLEVLKDINLKVKKGEVICIIGPSGAGKSTYLRSLNQLEKITSGKIFIKGDLFLHRENYYLKWECAFRGLIFSHTRQFWKTL